MVFASVSGAKTPSGSKVPGSGIPKSVSKAVAPPKIPGKMPSKPKALPPTVSRELGMVEQSQKELQKILNQTENEIELWSAKLMQAKDQLRLLQEQLAQLKEAQQRS